MPTPLTPVTLEADAIIAPADATAFWTGFVALTPLPTGKTVAQIGAVFITTNPTTNAIRVQMKFKN